MKGQWVPRHVIARLTQREAEAFVKLLNEVQNDTGFPLNEYEEEIVTDFISLLEEGLDEVPQT